MRILVVDDDAGLRKSVALILDDAGYVALQARSGEEGLEAAGSQAPQLILVDVRMPGMGGLEFVRRYTGEGGSAPVVVMTAYGSMELAVEAMQAGAYDYLAKPFGSQELLLVIRKAEEREQLRGEVARLRVQVRSEARYGEIVARSPGMVQALEMAAKVARHPTSVLVEGETGTGKELLARFIHDESDRSGGPFVAVNCGAIPETLMESEFFGHVKGAFTGADRERMGLFEAASGGTLLLDEVGEIPDPLQVKLLRALQEGEIRRVGESVSRPVDVRVVAATNRSLTDEVEAGRFRSDLYYRVAVVTLKLPPLRERPEDIPILVRHLLGLLGARLGMVPGGVTPGALAALVRYPWPGNVRELQNVLERAVVMSGSEEIAPSDLPDGVRDGAGALAVSSLALSDDDLSVKKRTAALERDLIVRALARTDGHRGETAKLLELSERALRYKIQDYAIEA